jgi:glycosyltransferase involved in cell wall biosynthesis
MTPSFKIVRITTVPISLKILLVNQMKFMANKGVQVIMMSSDGPEVKEVKENENCEHLIIPLTRRISPVHDLISLIRLTILLVKLKPSIVHSHTPKAGLIAMFAAWLARVPVKIHTVAGMPLMVEKGFKRWLLIQTEKLTYFFADEVWPNANSLKRFILENKLVNENKLQLISKGSSNGINLNNYTPELINLAELDKVKASIEYNPANFYLVVVGRVVSDKGIVELVNAFVQLQKSKPNLKLVLLGDYEPDLDPIPAETLDAIKNHPAVFSISWTNNVAQYLSICNLLVHASHREGFPNVLLQAGAMKLPIVCSNIDGNNDVVQHLETGLLFQVSDTNDLLSKLEFALNNPNKMKEMAAVLQSIVKENFDQKIIHETIYQNYLRLLKSSS